MIGTLPSNNSSGVKRFFKKKIPVSESLAQNEHFEHEVGFNVYFSIAKQLKN